MHPALPSPLERFQLTLRFRWLGLATIIAMTFLLRQFLIFDLWLVLIISAAALGELSLVTFFIYRTAKHTEWAASSNARVVAIISELQVLTEFVLLTWAVHLTGGVVSPLLAGYLLYLFVNGLRATVRALLLNTLWAIGLSTGLLVGEYYGYIAHVDMGILPEGFYHNAPFVTAVLIALVAFVMLTAIVSAWLSRYTRSRELEVVLAADALARRVEEVNTLRDISQQLAVLLDVNAVLDAIGESAVRLVGATDAHLYLYDEESGQFHTGVGVWNDGHRGLVTAFPRVSGGLSATVVHTKQPLVINNVENHPYYSSRQARTWGLKAIAGFPLKKSDRVLGVMNVAYLEPREFTEEQVRALSALADQAAIAVDNARLYTEVQRKIQELSALYAVASSTSQLGDAQSLMNDTLGIIVASLHADAALLIEVNVEREQYQLLAQRGLSSVAVNELKTDISSLRDGLTSEVIRTGQFVASPDATLDSRNVWRFEGAAQWRSLYSLPLRAQEHCIGVLHLLWLKRHEVLTAEAQLLAAIAQQLAAGLHNITLYNETKRRADELASLRAIGLATTSTLNLREQLRLLYERVSQLLSPDVFMVGLHDEPRHELKVEYLVEEGWFVRRPTIPLESDSLAAWVMYQQKPFHARDLALTGNLPARPLQLTRPARSWLGVPLVLKDNTVGLILVQSYKPNAFTSEDERFLVAAAQHVALAVDNARLFAESERRSRELTLVNKISRAVSASLDLDDVLDRATHALSDLLGYGYVNIFLIDGDWLKIRSKTGYDADLPPLRMSEGVVGRVARTGRAAFVANTTNEADYVALIPEVVTQVAVPIQHEGRILGVVDVEETRYGTLRASDLTLLGAIADQLGIAAANAEVYQDVLAREEFANNLGRVSMALASTLNEAQVLELVCRESLSIFAVDGASLFLREATTHMLDPQMARMDGMWSCRATAGSISPSTQLLRVHSGDLTNFVARAERLARGAVIHSVQDSPQLSVEWRDTLGAQSLLLVPLIKEREVTGALVLVDVHRPTRFGDADLTRASIFATQATLAIENARLYEQTRNQLEELKQTQARLVETERRAAVGELAAGLAHEINNPLTAILGHAQLLQQAKPSGEHADTGLQAISLAAQRIARIVQEFVRLTSIENTRREILDLREVLRDATEICLKRKHTQDISIELDLLDVPQWVLGNRNLLGQVAVNILVNSIEAMPRGGVIGVMLRDADAGQIICTIRDQGVGIVESDLKRVFEPGYTTKVESGTVRGVGLGLYTAEQVIRAHRGAIQLQSTSGQGTTVSFVLPRAKGPVNDGE